MVITGDLKQSDRTLNNGLLDIIEKLKIYKNSSKKSKKSANVELIELDSSDIQRSPIVSQILEIYNSDGKSNEYNEVNNIISSIDHYLNDNNINEQIVDTNQDAAMLPKSQIPKGKNSNDWNI